MRQPFYISDFVYAEKIMRKKPKRADTVYKIATILKFSLRHLFVLKSTASPIPAPEQRPAIADPKDSDPATYNSVIATDIAQLGIRPTSAVTKGCR
jgi:hypothetical protein